MQVTLKPLQPRTDQPIYALDASPDGKLLALGQQSDPSGSAYLTLWDLNALTQLREVESGLLGMIHSAQFSPDNSALAYVKNDMHAHLHDLQQQQSHILPTEDGEVFHVSYAYEQNVFVASGTSTQVWDGKSLESIWTLPDSRDKQQRHDHPAQAALNPDATRVAVTGAQAGEVAIYQLSSKQIVQRLAGAPEGARWLGFDPRGRYLAAIETNTHGMFIWDVQSGEMHLSHIFNSKSEDYCSLAFHPDGEHFALGMLGDYVLIAQLKDGQFVFDKPVHRGQVWGLAFTRDGRRLVSGGDDGVAYVYELD